MWCTLPLSCARVWAHLGAAAISTSSASDGGVHPPLISLAELQQALNQPHDEDWPRLIGLLHHSTSVLSEVVRIGLSPFSQIFVDLLVSSEGLYPTEAAAGLPQGAYLLHLSGRFPRAVGEPFDVWSARPPAAWSPTEGAPPDDEPDVAAGRPGAGPASKGGWTSRGAEEAAFREEVSTILRRWRPDRFEHDPTNGRSETQAGRKRVSCSGGALSTSAATTGGPVAVAASATTASATTTPAGALPPSADAAHDDPRRLGVLHRADGVSWREARASPDKPKNQTETRRRPLGGPSRLAKPRRKPKQKQNKYAKRMMGGGAGAQTTADVAQLDSSGILSPHWRGLNQLWASLHDLQTYDIECAHAATKIKTSRLNKWFLVAARAVNAAAKNAAVEARRHAPAEPALPQVVAKAASANPPRWRPHRSALQLFHKQCAARDAKLGRLRGPPTTTEYWAAVKREFAQLSAKERADLEDMLFLSAYGP